MIPFSKDYVTIVSQVAFNKKILSIKAHAGFQIRFLELRSQSIKLQRSERNLILLTDEHYEKQATNFLGSEEKKRKKP